jgi:hypothetical protein
MRASRTARFAEFVRRLDAAPAARTFEEARRQVADVLAAVEDEMTDIPSRDAAWPSDGRLRAPDEEAERASGNLAWRRFRSAAHHTVIGANGSVWILGRTEPSQPWSAGAVILDKPGLDGRRAEEL